MVFYPKELSGPYVDRPAFRGEALTLIKSGLTKHISLGDTHGVFGIGKTTSLAKLFYELKTIDAPDTPEELKALMEWKPIWLSLDAFSIHQTNEKIVDKESFNALRQNFDDYKKMLVLLGQQIDAQAFADLGSKLEELTGESLKKTLSINIQAQGGNVDIGTLAKVAESQICGGNTNIEVKVENWELILREALESLIACFIQEFIKIFKPLSKHIKFVLLADDFDSIIGYPIGNWFLNMIKQMDNTITLLARTISESQINWDKNQMAELTLKPFGVGEVCQYMNQRELALTDAQIEKVYKFSKSGHPLLVSMAGDLLARLDRRGTLEIDAVLDRLVGKPRFGKEEVNTSISIDEEDLKRRIFRIIDELRDDIMKYDPALLYGLDVIALTRKFDYNLLKYMFAKHLLEEASEKDEAKREETAQRLAHLMIMRMPEYSIVQELEDQEKPETVYRVHYLVREGMEENLCEDEPPEYSQRIHQYLCDYYQGKEMENMQEQAEYASMFRLEHAAWQKDMIEWLHHLYSLKDRTVAHLQLCKLFLESLDWMGWYIAFDFCANLLRHWQQTQPEKDEEITQLLQNFQNAYPLGYIKRGKGDWKMVYKSLTNLIAKLKLNLPAAQMNSTQRMVSGHIHRFLAEAFRFIAPPNFVQAEAAYRNSLEYFEVRWNQAWIVNYLADLNLDWVGQLEQAGKNGEAFEKATIATKYAHQSNEMALEEKNFLDQDHELMSQNYRILGSIAVSQEDWNEAFQEYTRSIAHAYIFHFLEDNQDEYSYQFYQDTGEQVLQAIQKLAEQGSLDKTSQVCHALRDFWEQQAPFFMEEIFSKIPADFDLRLALSDIHAECLLKYIMPVLPEVGTVGEPIETGVSVSQTIAGVIDEE